MFSSHIRTVTHFSILFHLNLETFHCGQKLKDYLKSLLIFLVSCCMNIYTIYSLNFSSEFFQAWEMFDFNLAKNYISNHILHSITNSSFDYF